MTHHYIQYRLDYQALLVAMMMIKSLGLHAMSRHSQRMMTEPASNPVLQSLLLLAFCRGVTAAQLPASEEHEPTGMGFLMFVVALLLAGFILGMKFGSRSLSDGEALDKPRRWWFCEGCRSNVIGERCPTCMRRRTSPLPQTPTRMVFYSSVAVQTEAVENHKQPTPMTLPPAVHIAPARGERYHVSSHCHGLRPAVRVVKYTPCATCTGR